MPSRACPCCPSSSLPLRQPLTQIKYDLVAAKRIEGMYPCWGLWAPTPGHRAGVAVGLRFAGRGALKALGVHSTYFTGIQTV